MTGIGIEEDLLWPPYHEPRHVEEIERIPLRERGLPATTWDLVARAARLWPERAAAHVLPDGARWQRPRTITYLELARATARTAAVLRGVGVRPDDVVGVLSPNTAELLPAILGGQAAGIVAPVNPTLRAEEIVDLLRRAGASVLIAAGPDLGPALWSGARAVAAQTGVRALLALRPTGPGHDDPNPDLPLEPLPGIQVGYLDPFQQTGRHPDDPPIGGSLAQGAGPDTFGLTGRTSQDLAAFFHTGGTTATPKLAAHTHAMEVTNAWSLAAGLDLPENNTILGALPLFHVNALVVTLLTPLLLGRTVVWAGPLGYRDPDLMRNFWQILQRYRIAAMSGVPTVYQTLSAVPVNADLSSLQLCIVGAAPLPNSVARAWLEHTGVPLCEGYGLTEATCASARTLLGHAVEDAVGQRLPYQQIKAVSIDPVNGDWTDLPPGQAGTLAIGGPVVFPGYLVGRDHNGPVLDGQGKLRGGWLDTGDLGSVDSAGFVRLTGRAKDLIIRGGHNIDPAVIEEALRAHPRVRDVSAVGRPDRHAGEVPVAYVVLTEGPDDAPVDEAELVAWAAGHVPEPAAAPKAVTVLPALPITAVGKGHKVPLREDATRRELGPQLSAAGVLPPQDESWCRQVDGRLTVTLSIATAEQLERVRVLLGHYALDLHLTLAEQ